MKQRKEGESHCVDTPVDDEVAVEAAIVAAYDDEETSETPTSDFANNINKSAHVALFDEKQDEDFVEWLESPFPHKEKMLEASIETKESHVF